MPKLLTTVLILLFFSSSESVVAASMFWSVKSAQAEVYLLGSVHVAKPDYYPLPSEIEDGFKRADVLVVEINPLSVNSQQQMGEFQQKSLYAGTDTIKNHIDRYTYDLTTKFLQQAHLPSAPLLKMKPAILSVTLSMTKLATLGYTPANGIDMYFLQKAIANKLPIEELESTNMQMELLLNIPNADVLLRYTLEQMDKIEPMMKDLDTAWKSGDTNFVTKLLLSDSERDYPELKRTNHELIYKRNISMAKTIEQYLHSNKSYFVIVGTGHLVGENGIIALLQLRGYKTKQH